ncbi:TonB-dependent siderophore receptor [Variovorax paradoxus]|uniref:TonB-dependent siderophore receptor n=1 Tax=Variovorax paradoxus TaxID=34073 RepID=UPI001931DD72|nr:TonB-dependent siderophore receptor [Variovorax paradoxus]
MPHHAPRFRPSPLALAALLCSLSAAAQQAAPETAAPAKAAETRALGAITVTADRDSRTEGSGSYTARAAGTATRLDMSPRETPQSVSVVTRQQMDDQGLRTVADVLAQSTGITVNELDSERTGFYARGFSIDNFQIDGMSRGSNSPLTDTALYDRIEIVRGANGLMGGTGDPSATINFIRKRPTREFQASAGLTLGRWDLRRADVDIAGPLNASGSVRGRFVFADSDRKSFMDYYREKKKLGMVSIEADLTSSTLLTAGFDLQDNKPRGATWGAVPYWNSNGTLANLPRNFSITTPWSGWDKKQSTAFASLEHRFDNGWRARLGLARTESEVDRSVVYAGSGYPNPATGGGLSLWSGVGWAKETRDNLDLHVSGPVSFLGRKHELIAGWNGDWRESDTPAARVTYPYSATVPNYHTWNGDLPQPVAVRTGAYTLGHTRLGGGYVAGRFSLADPLTVIVGARVSNYTTRTNSYSTAGVYNGFSGISRHKNEVTPYAGIVYDIDDRWSAYASYTDVFAPQSYKDRNNNFVDPATGTNIEAGIKGELLEGRLNVSGAVFRTKKENVATLDTSVPAGFTLADGSSAYVTDGTGTIARGVEAEVSGQLTPAWNLTAGYTYMSVDRPACSCSVPIPPRHLLRLSTAYRLGGALQGLTLGGSVSVQSATTNLSWYNRPGTTSKAEMRQPGYTLFNVMASYELNRNLTVALNVNNLFDKKYYRNIGFYDGVYWGEPRNVTVSLRAKF